MIGSAGSPSAPAASARASALPRINTHRGRHGGSTSSATSAIFGLCCACRQSRGYPRSLGPPSPRPPSGDRSCRRASHTAWFRVASSATCAAARLASRCLPRHCQGPLVTRGRRRAARSLSATCIKIQRHASGSVKTRSCTDPPFCAPTSRSGRGGCVLESGRLSRPRSSSTTPQRGSSSADRFLQGGTHGSDGHLASQSVGDDTI